ncbi:MAG: TetR/AcrR family transcriptional regulator [Cyanobacteria bacterium J06623_4]
MSRIECLSIRYRMEKQKDVSRLDAQAWIRAGAQVLAQSGVNAVKVEPIAKQLQVTKGSFYWHFKNRRALLEAILHDWVAAETDRVIEQVESEGGSAKEKLLRLFELTVQDDGQVERAIRAWAVSDSMPAEVLQIVDQRRLNYTKDLFVAVGFTPFEALVRARLVYYALVAEFMLSKEPEKRADRLKEMRLQHKILTHQD